jgi:hypothetical protein
MLPEQRGILSFFKRRFSRNKRSAMPRQNGLRQRKTQLESLEPRQMLTANLYVDFGDFLGSQTLSEANWARLGLTVPNNQFSWINGPLFPYAGNPNLTYTPFAIDQNFPIDPGRVAESGWQFQTGPQLPISKLEFIEFQVIETLQRQFAPFDVNVIEVGARNLGEARDLLASNNRLDDPYQVFRNPPPQNLYNLTTDNPAGHVPPGFLTSRIDPTTLLPVAEGGKDVYVLVGGWTRGNNPAIEIGGESGNFGFSTPNFIAPFPMLASDPLFPGQAIDIHDSAAAVSADTITREILQGFADGTLTSGNSIISSLATVVAQMASVTYGMGQTSSGEPFVGNPFFDTDVDILSRSDIMREGRHESVLAEQPSLNQVSVFSRLPLMLGDFNQDPLFTQNAYDFWVNNIDVGPNNGTDFNLIGTIGTTFLFGQNVLYVTGTGAYDHITIADDPANPGMALVTIDAFRTAAMAPSDFLGTFSYDLDFTLPLGAIGNSLIIEGCDNADQIDIDPNLPGLAGTQVVIFGGAGIDNISMIGTGAEDVSVAVGNVEFFRFMQPEHFDTLLGFSNGAIIQLQEFDDTSLVHLENFNSLTYQMPQFLGSNFTVDARAGSGLTFPPTASGVDMLIDGTAGPTVLQTTPLGVATIEFTNIPTVNIGVPLGATNDSLIVRSTLGFADGLQNFSVNLGPGADTLFLTGTNFTLPVAGGAFVFDGGTGKDTIDVRGNTDWTLIDADPVALTDGMLVCGGGGSITLKNMLGDNAKILGGGGHLIEVDSWSGIATLGTSGGTNTIRIGTAATIVTGTVNATGGSGSDTFEINNWTGTGTLDGGGGNDTFEVNKWTGSGTLQGGAGNDTFHVNKLAGFGVTLAGGAGIDTFVIGSGGSSAGVTGVPTIEGDDGLDTISLDDSALAVLVDYFLNDSSITSTLPGFNGVFFDDTVENVTVTGTQAANAFNVAPSLRATFRVNGEAPAPGAPGVANSLNIDFFGTSGAKLNPGLAPPGPGNGAWTFASGHKPVIFTSIGGDFQQSSQAPTFMSAAGSSQGKGSKPLVKVYDASSNDLLYSFYAYETSFAGGVRVALIDMNGDSVPEVIVAPGPGRAGQVKVYDGAKLLAAAPTTSQHLVSAPNSALIGAAFYSDGTSYKSGLYVAGGDVDGDGKVDVITSTQTGGGKIRVFTLSGSTWAQRRSFTPYTSSEKVTTGAVVAVADVDGDGRPDIVTAPGAGTAVIVKVFDGLTKTTLRKFNGFESSFKNGVSIAAADLDGDGLAEIMLGAGANGQSRVRVLNGFGKLQKEFKAFTTGNSKVPLRIAAHEVDGEIELFVAQSNDGRSREIRHFDPLTGQLVDSFLENDSTFAAGVNLG